MTKPRQSSRTVIFGSVALLALVALAATSGTKTSTPTSSAQKTKATAATTAKEAPKGVGKVVKTEAEWKKTVITDGGLVITPLLAFQADVDYANASSDSLTAINQMAANPDINTSSDFRSSFARYMATAGLELRYPILFSAIGSSHVIEPMAQLFVRPNEQYVGGLEIPNDEGTNTTVIANAAAIVRLNVA